MRINQIALIALLTLILLPVHSAFASHLAARTPGVRPFNLLQAATPTAIPPTAGGLPQVARVPSATPAPTEVPSGPPLSLTLMLGFTCLALLLIVGVLVVGFLAGVTNRKEAEKSKKEK
ncbi:MAG: hypothetical protein M1282_04980 [Chloroflexi bacterium]|nr:hypothetical protein [Chloroflexota bacterium]